MGRSGGSSGGGSTWGAPQINSPINTEFFLATDKLKKSFMGAVGMGKDVATNAEAEEMRKQTEMIANQQREMAERSANEKAAMDKELQDKLLKEQQGQDAKSAKQRQAKLAQGAKGRSDTILTGPLGLTAAGPKSGKTLLGA